MPEIRELRGWGAVLVLSLCLVLLLIMLGIGPRNNIEAGIWPDAAKWFVVPGVAMCVAAIAARPKQQAVAAEVLLGRLMWFCLGLFFLGFGIEERSPGHRAMLLALPGWVLLLVVGSWLVFVPDHDSGRRSSKVGRMIGFAVGFPGGRPDPPRAGLR